MKHEMIRANDRTPTIFDLITRPLEGFGMIPQAADFGGMKTDIIDKGDRYQLKADMPGFDKKDIKVSFNDGVLTISAQRHAEQQRKEQGGYIVQERSEGSCERQFSFDDVDPQKIYAAYTNGELDVCLEKQQRTQGTEISVN